MERRTFLRWATHGLGAVFAAVLGVPAVVYLLDPRNRPAAERGFRPTGVRYKDLRPEEPREVTIREAVRDAWTLHPDEVVGRVWLVRRRPGDGAARAKVDAYNTTCPHLGCSVNFNAGDRQFLCPCHGGCFRLDDGARIDPATNPAPRGMDSLATELRPVAGAPADDPDFEILVKYEKFKPNQPDKVPL